MRFRALIDDLRAACAQISDSRQPGKVGYPLVDCYLSAFALFFVQDPSLLEFQRRFQEEVQRNNLTSIFDIHAIPSDTQLRDVVDVHDCAPLAEVYRSWFAKLQRSKKLEVYQTLGGYYLLTLDGLFPAESPRVLHAPDIRYGGCTVPTSESRIQRAPRITERHTRVTATSVVRLLGDQGLNRFHGPPQQAF